MASDKDKKLALIFMGVFFLLAGAFVIGALFLLHFIYNLSQVASLFIDDAIDSIGGML